MPPIVYTAVFWLVVQKLRRESAHAGTFDRDFELTVMRIRGFSSQFLDNQPENRCTTVLLLLLCPTHPIVYTSILLLSLGVPPYYYSPVPGCAVTSPKNHVNPFCHYPWVCVNVVVCVSVFL